MCGITFALRRPGAGSQETVFPEAMRMSLAQAHRGQEGHGFAAFNPPYDTFDVSTSSSPISIIPLLSDAQMQENYAICDGSVVLGQMRYATAGALIPENLQPMRNDSSHRLPPARRKVIVFNGTIANYTTLRSQLKRKGTEFRGDTDTEVLLRLIAHEDDKRHAGLNTPANYQSIFKVVDSKIDGAASVALADGIGNAVFYRSRHGIRPLFYMETDDGLLLAASETVAFKNLKGVIREVPPGHVVVYDRRHDRLTAHCVAPPDFVPASGEITAKLDVFEPLYFQSAASEIYGQSNNETRKILGARMGALLEAQIRNLSPKDREDVRIVPMPNSGIPYALGAFAKLADLKLLGATAFSMSIEKVARLRAFMGNKQRREQLLGSNYQLMQDAIEGKIIYLFDDTLVRGDTSRVLSERLKSLGAREVHWVIGSPPIIGSDYYGINIPSIRELAFWQVWRASNTNDRARLYPGGSNTADTMDLQLLGKKMAAHIGADSVTYMPLQDLKALLPGGPERFNYSSLSGVYPTPKGQRNFDRAVQKLIAA